MSTEKDAKRPCHEDSEERTLNRGWIEDAWHDDPADEADDAEDARNDSDARGSDRCLAGLSILAVLNKQMLS